MSSKAERIVKRYARQKAAAEAEERAREVMRSDAPAIRGRATDKYNNTSEMMMAYVEPSSGNLILPATVVLPEYAVPLAIFIIEHYAGQTSPEKKPKENVDDA